MKSVGIFFHRKKEAVNLHKFHLHKMFVVHHQIGWCIPKWKCLDLCLQFSFFLPCWPVTNKWLIEVLLWHFLAIVVAVNQRNKKKNTTVWKLLNAQEFDHSINNNNNEKNNDGAMAIYKKKVIKINSNWATTIFAFWLDAEQIFCCDLQHCTGKWNVYF